MKRPLAFFVWLVVVASARADVPILSFDEVQPGMTGTGRTVFEGTRIETFGVEILGKLPNVGPSQNLILARLSGGPLENTGVLAGMSGSPVFIGERLIGAIAYSWGFSKSPIAGVTPIEEMLEIAKAAPAPGAGAVRAPSMFLPERHDVSRLPSVAMLDALFSDLAAGLVAARGAGPTSIPLAVSGWDPRGQSRAWSRLTEAGFLPMQMSGAGAGTERAEPLQPGSPMGLKLVRGDVEMTATGTVTWVEGNQVLGFGHPLFGLGAVDLPLTGARVEALLPSLAQSMRIARPLAEVGALRQDRSTGVLGRTDVQPTMIPVRLRLTGGDFVEHDFSFDVADDPLLAPLLLYFSLNGIIASKERVPGNSTVRLQEGSVIKMVGSEDVALDNLFAGRSAFDYGAGLPAYILYLLMNNASSRPQISGVNLLLDYEESPRTARVRRVSLDRFRVAAGDTVEVTVVLAPYRGPDRTLRRAIVVPPETPPGSINIVVGGALAVSRVMGPEEPVFPRDLEHLVGLINRLRRNDRIYILATREDSGVLLDGVHLPNLPPSAATLLLRPGTGQVSPVARRSLLEEILVTDSAVEGSARIELEVEVR